jgi:serine/threonine-protein kinase
MPHAAASQFFDGLRASRLLDDGCIGELESRPEAESGDIDSLANYAQERGWLTAYQALELREGRGHRLSVSGYRIFDKLDDGPAGTTFKALHPALQEPVSLRVLRADWLAPADTPTDYLARVHNACLAQSPHLAGVLDAGTFEDAPFIVQEYVDGCDLFHLVNEMGALPVGLACEYARQAAVALRAAHEKDVAHGEVSPYSLLLTPVKRAVGSNGDVSIRPRPGARIKLVELALSPRRPPVGELTFGQSDRLGHVAFLPPERLTNGDRTPDGDMYGLGAMLYYLLTTRPPQPGDSPVEVLLNLQQAEPTPIQTLRSDLPAAVAELIQRLLARDPSKRPAATEAAETLAPYCEQLEPPEGMPYAVPLASETMTLPAVPTAAPVPEGTYESPANGAAGPVVEPMPEVHPLDDHHYTDVGRHEHHEPFSPSALGGSSKPIVRKPTKATKRNMVWILAGLFLHLTAVALLIGYLTNWFAFSRTPDPDTHRTDEKKTTPTKSKPKTSD